MVMLADTVELVIGSTPTSTPTPPLCPGCDRRVLEQVTVPAAPLATSSC
jgi:hypothetical protein